MLAKFQDPVLELCQELEQRGTCIQTSPGHLPTAKSCKKNLSTKRLEKSACSERSVGNLKKNMKIDRLIESVLFPVTCDKPLELLLNADPATFGLGARRPPCQGQCQAAERTLLLVPSGNSHACSPYTKAQS